MKLSVTFERNSLCDSHGNYSVVWCLSLFMCENDIGAYLCVYCTYKSRVLCFIILFCMKTI